jgi:hypothetical protein
MAEALGDLGDRSPLGHGHVLGVAAEVEPARRDHPVAGRKPLTALPTASTRPATSKPRMDVFGLVTPSLSRKGRPSPRGTRSALTRASPELTVVATALIRTSPSAGTGVGTSLICTTSGGPYLSQTAAFTVHPIRTSPRSD